MYGLAEELLGLSGHRIDDVVEVVVLVQVTKIRWSSRSTNAVRPTRCPSTAMVNWSAAAVRAVA
jgi:hypothetical protein